MAYKITDSCVACGTCIGECPVEAISAGDIYVIDPNTCIDCGTWRRRLPQRGDHSGITHGYNMGTTRPKHNASGVLFRRWAEKVIQSVFPE